MQGFKKFTSKVLVSVKAVIVLVYFVLDVAMTDTVRVSSRGLRFDS